jgi:hypothetical protein
MCLASHVSYARVALRAFSVYAHPDSGRPAYVYHYSRDVVVPSRARAGRTASPALGVANGGGHRRRIAVEGSDRGGISHGRRAGLPLAWRRGNCSSAKAWRRLRPFSGALIVLLIAAPWHVLATLRNPPYLSFSACAARPRRISRISVVLFHERAGAALFEPALPARLQHGAALYFWLFHLLWLFPWSVYFPAVAKLSYKPVIARTHAATGALLDRVSCWCSSLSRPRRNTTRCRAIRRWRCCWARDGGGRSGCGAARV